eukprot:CAMPEP_0116564156 /NCGR_PEP_ID=MMETSP0397-20121206/13147_1 /TAXON_ID=216820 /ORGANISM="Cyclophora tenuis, Strain ECT3854" /LENGTH=298 /DNA_ID=CAMNT_0004090709 /DNA_START=21 /DNA_END=917 /DNA_ORIENTATION=+
MSEVSSLAIVMGFAPGAIGGVCNTIVGHPIDLIKVRMQTNSASAFARAAQASALVRSNTFTELRAIVAMDGLGGLYRGVTAPLLAVIPAFAINFWSFDTAKQVIQRYGTPDGQGTLSIVQTGLAGSCAGVGLACVLGPSERIKCLMQVDKTRYSSFMDCATQVYKEGGVRSVFRGFGATVMRDVPGNFGYFGGYEFFRRLFARAEGRENPSLASTFMAGGLGGVLNWIVANPFDVAKSVYQTAPPGKYNSVFEVYRHLLREEGAAAFFRGLSPALIRAFPSNAACLAGVETARTIFQS